MVYHFRVHKENGGYWAECIEINGCNTLGDSTEELVANAAEALNLHLSEPDDSSIIFPRPNGNLKGRNVLAVPVDPQVAMAMKIRQARLKKGLTQRMAASLLGFNHLYAYQKLESAKTCNPGITMLARLKRVFPDLRVDEVIG